MRFLIYHWQFLKFVPDNTCLIFCILTWLIHQRFDLCLLLGSYWNPPPSHLSNHRCQNRGKKRNFWAAGDLEPRGVIGHSFWETDWETYLLTCYSVVHTNTETHLGIHLLSALAKKQLYEMGQNTKDISTFCARETPVKNLAEIPEGTSYQIDVTLSLLKLASAILYGITLYQVLSRVIEYFMKGRMWMVKSPNPILEPWDWEDVYPAN